MNSAYYFECLPRHPKPRRLESLSSFILRLAEANGIRSLHVLSNLLGIPATTLSHLSDYPLLSFGTITKRTCTTHEDLLTTTFFHLGKKFGRSTRPSPLARFLKGSLGSYLRYCPICLSEDSHYSLIWRFLILEGCPTHNCLLLESCGHCGSSLPLFNPRLQVGKCQFCSEDLSTCPTEQLSEEDTYLASLRMSYLEYFLYPPFGDDENGLAQQVGRHLSVLRHKKQLFAQHIAAHLGVPESQIRRIERGVAGQGAPFRSYVQYADYLGVSLLEVFQGSHVLYQKQVTPSRTQLFTSVTSHAHDQIRYKREGELIQRLKEAIPQLKALGRPITAKTVSQFVGVTRQGLQHYPALKAVWEQITQELQAEHEQWEKQREDELIRQVREAVTTLIAQGFYPSQKAISALVHISPGGLRYHPRVRAFLKQVMNERYSTRSFRNQPPEEDVVERVQKAFLQLQSSDQLITLKRISGMVGLTLYRLRLYPEVVPILNRIAEEGRLQCKRKAIHNEQILAEQVRQAIQQLHDQGQPVSRQAVGQMIGLTPRALAKYHLVRPLLSQIVEEYRNDRPQRTEQRESELLKQVRQVIKQLQEQGQPITQKAVSQRLGLTAPALMYYPRSERSIIRWLKKTGERDESRHSREKQPWLSAYMQQSSS